MKHALSKSKSSHDKKSRLRKPCIYLSVGFLLALYGLCLWPPTSCFLEGPDGLENEGESGTNSTATNLACHYHVEDPAFERFFDATCLATLQGSAFPCPLESAHRWWRASSQELRFDSLLFGTFSLAGMATLLLAGGVPDHRNESKNAVCLLLKVVFLFLWYSVQASQIFFMLISTVTGVLGYIDVTYHYSMCFREWSGIRVLGGLAEGTKTLHLVAVPTALLQPLVFMRLAQVLLGFSAMKLSTVLFPLRVYMCFVRCERLFIKLVQAMVLCSLVLLLLFFVYFLALLPFPMAMLLGTTLFLSVLGFFRSKTSPRWIKSKLRPSLDPSQLSDEWASLTWMASTYEGLGAVECVVNSFCDLCVAFLHHKEKTLTKVVYLAMAGSILSPMLIFGLWLGVEMLSCEHSLVGTVTMMYKFLFGHILLLEPRLPDILALFEEFPPDFVSAMEWIANLNRYLDIEPAEVLRNSRLLIAIQTSLAVLKAVMTYGNIALRALSSKEWGLATVPIKELECGAPVLEKLKADGMLLEECHKFQQDHEVIVKEAVRQNWQALQFASAERRADADIVKLAMDRDELALQYALGEAVISVIRERGADMLERASSEVKDDEKVVKIAYEQKRELLRIAGHNAVKAIVAGDADALEYASEEHRDDGEIAFEAFKLKQESLGFAGIAAVKYVVVQDADALSFASMEVRNNADVVLAALRKRPELLSIAGHDAVKAVLAVKPDALQHASAEHKNNGELVYSAFRVKPEVIAWAGPEARTYCCETNLAQAGRPAVLYAVGKDASALQFAGEFRDDRGVVQAAFATNCQVLQYAGPSAVKSIVAKSPDALQHASDAHKNDGDIVWQAFLRKPEVLDVAGPDAVRFCCESNLKSADLAAVLYVVRRQPASLQHASEKMRESPEVVQAAMSKNPAVLKYAGPSAVKSIVTKSPNSLQHASEVHRNSGDIVWQAFLRKPQVLTTAGRDAVRFCCETNLKNANLQAVLYAVERDPSALQHASEKMRDDIEVVRAATSKAPELLKHAGRSAARTIIASRPADLRHASDAHKDDPNIVWAAFTQKPELLQVAGPAARKHCYQNLKNAPRPAVLFAVRANGACFRFASAELREDLEVVQAAYEKSPANLRYAGRGAVLAIVRRDGLALQHASQEHRGDQEIAEVAVAQNSSAAQFQLGGATQKENAQSSAADHAESPAGPGSSTLAGGAR